MQKRWAERKRPLPPEIAWAQERYSEVQAVDGSTLDALNQPFAAISMEMVYRSLYFFTQAHHRGQADDVLTYLTSNTKLFGIIKRKRKSAHPSPLELIPILTDAKLPYL